MFRHPLDLTRAIFYVKAWPLNGTRSCENGLETEFQSKRDPSLPKLGWTTWQNESEDPSETPATSSLDLCHSMARQTLLSLTRVKGHNSKRSVSGFFRWSFPLNVSPWRSVISDQPEYTRTRFRSFGFQGQLDHLGCAVVAEPCDFLLAVPWQPGVLVRWCVLSLA